MGRLTTVYDREARRCNVIKLKELGYSYVAIGSMYGVSDVTAYRWVCRDKLPGRSKTSAPYLNEKPPDGRCEICGEYLFPEHHSWDFRTTSLGVWACSKCRAMARLLDARPELAKKYLDLKRLRIRSYAKRLKDKEFTYGQ